MYIPNERKVDPSDNLKEFLEGCRKAVNKEIDYYIAAISSKGFRSDMVKLEDTTFSFKAKTDGNCFLTLEDSVDFTDSEREDFNKYIYERLQ